MLPAGMPTREDRSTLSGCLLSPPPQPQPPLQPALLQSPRQRRQPRPRPPPPPPHSLLPSASKLPRRPPATPSIAAAQAMGIPYQAPGAMLFTTANSFRPTSLFLGRLLCWLWVSNISSKSAPLTIPSSPFTSALILRAGTQPTLAVLPNMLTAALRTLPLATSWPSPLLPRHRHLLSYTMPPRPRAMLGVQFL